MARYIPQVQAAVVVEWYRPDNYMRNKFKNNGSVFLMVVFVIALLSALVIGMLEINMQDVQLMKNRMSAAQAIATAEAGLNDAFSELRTNSGWRNGFTNKAFNGGSYTVSVTGSLPTLTVTSTGTTSDSFVARVAADLMVSNSNPYILRIDSFRINE